MPTRTRCIFLKRTKSRFMCNVVIGYPHKSFDICHNQALAYIRAAMGWPIDPLNVALTFPLKICSVFHIQESNSFLLLLSISLGFVYLWKKNNLPVLTPPKQMQSSLTFIGYRCVDLYVHVIISRCIEPLTKRVGGESCEVIEFGML
jgi:hypothetical protein